MEMFWENNSPWISDDPKLWHNLVGNIKPIRVEKEKTLYAQGNMPLTVYLVLSGRVRITCYLESGGERQLYIAEKGCLIGENSAILSQPHTTSAVAIVESVLYAIPASEFLKNMAQDFSLAYRVMQLICKKHNILYHQLLETSFAQSLRRICQILLNLVDQYGTPLDNGTRINIRFTHQDVANMIGTSRVTVSNAFSELSEYGILSRQEGYIIIHDTHALRQLLQQYQDTDNPKHHIG